MIKNTRHYLLVLFTCLALPLMAEVEYDIITLAPTDYPESSYFETRANDLSENGYVTGEIIPESFGPPLKGFIFHSTQGFRVIDNPLNNESVITRKVNEHGVVAGTTGPYNDLLPFIFDSRQDPAFNFIEGAYRPIGISNDGKALIKSETDTWHPNGDCTNTHRWHIYDYEKKIIIAEVVHSIHDQHNEFTRLFRDKNYTMNGTGFAFGPDWYYSPELKKMENLHSLIPYFKGHAGIRALSENGTIAGFGYSCKGSVCFEDGCYDKEDLCENEGICEVCDKYGYIWDPEQGIELFQAPKNLFSLEDISSVNNRRQAVGKIDTGDDDDYLPQAFFYDKSLGMIALGTLGGHKSRAKDLNDHGQVIGSSYSTPLIKGKRAFIWDQKNGMRDLSDLIPKNSGWKKLIKATKINNDGYIIGTGIYLGEERAFLLIPRK